MDERLFARLAARLAQESVVLASVLETRGAVPRAAGSRMLIGAHASDFSVGGGMAEARVVAAARALIQTHGARQELRIDLGGGPQAAGVCGGAMRIGLKRWDIGDRDRAEELARQLGTGNAATLHPDEYAGELPTTLAPDARLLIVGGGHCAAALHDLALHLDYELVVYDARPECFDTALFPHATTLCGDADTLARALDTPRTIHAVLLNRDYEADVAALHVLAARSPAFVGMMGSMKRIATVAAALPGHDALLARIAAPAGIEIGAQTPHEIAVSILAQLVRFRRTLAP